VGLCSCGWSREKEVAGFAFFSVAIVSFYVDLPLICFNAFDHLHNKASTIGKQSLLCIATMGLGRLVVEVHKIFIPRATFTSQSFFVVDLEVDQVSFRIDCFRLICFIQVPTNSSHLLLRISGLFFQIDRFLNIQKSLEHCLLDYHGTQQRFQHESTNQIREEEGIEGGHA
jgi:hypothetical protein